MTPSARLASLLGPPGSALRRWRLLLAAGLVVLVAYLLGPYPPWRFPEATLIPREGQSHIHIILVATWYAVALNAALAVLLLATSGLWARDEREPLAATAPRRRPLGGVRLALLLGACVLAGLLRWNLAHHGVWWDEAWSVHHAIVGTVEPDREAPERLVFEPAPWTDTLWYYRKATNHVLYSVAARVSLGGWRAVTGAPPEAWDDFVLRIPAFAAAVLSVLLLGLLVHDLGFPRAAPAAGFLLAVHPWHIRFGADGRGYAFMVLAAIVAAWCLLHGLREARWRWWLGYGAAQFALLWVHPMSLYFPLALAGAGTLGIWFGPGTREDRQVRLGRFAAANALAAMAYLQVMAPNLAQAVALRHEWVKASVDAGTLGPHLWLFLATGLPPSQPWLPDETFPTLRNLWGGGLWVRAITHGVLPALALLGLVRVLRRPGPERTVVLGVVAAVPLALLHRAVQDFLLIERFVIYGLVAVVPLIMIGAETLLEAILPRRLRRRAVPLGLAAFLVAYQVFVAPQTRVLLERPQMPTREIAAYLAKAGEGIPGGALRAGVALGGDVPDIYDPYVQHVHEREEIAALAARARAEGRPLYVFYGYNHANRTGPHKAVFEILDDERYFEPAAHFGAIESEFVYRILRYTGRPLGKD